MSTTDLRPVVRVCSWCPEANEKTLALKARGFEVTHGICEECERTHFPAALARRARIAAALLTAHSRHGVVPAEDVPSVACRIDREIEAITREEAHS